MKPLIHARMSVKKHGGCIDEYIPIHNFIDSSKATMADVRHRAILHSSFGIFVAERVFGTYITLSSGKQVSVRDIAEEHVFQDLGFIPSVEKWLRGMHPEDWMYGPVAKQKNSLKLFSHLKEKKVD
jgi:Domain of unknown function (DUF6915)